jgi:MFS transporter, FLVCR family, feline leukemia virus subgroup C receptor-related protein
VNTVTYNTMGDYSKEFYKVSDATVNMFSTIAVIVFVIAVVPIALLANNYGLRKSVRPQITSIPLLLSVVYLIVVFYQMIAASGLLLVCGVGRCFFPGPNMIFIIFILQIANAVVAPIVNSTPSMLATVWFPPEERAIATAVAFLAQFLGTAVAFLLGFVVNSTDDIAKRIWIEAALSLAVCIPILIYFPDGPPTPPSASSLRKVEQPQSAVGRHFVKELNRSQMFSDVRDGLPPKAPLLYQAFEYFEDVKKLGSSKPFWLATAAGGIPAGLYAAWSGYV